jgi:Glyoxalase/Bleomycin resistance protein/Dioxygenase superfamily
LKLLRVLTVCVFTVGTCLAQLPEFYKRVNRVTWLVKSLDHPLQGWEQIGLSDVRVHEDLAFEGLYRSKRVSVKARVATGSLGSLTVDMLQPVDGDNVFNDFLARHGDGIFAIVHEVATMADMTKEIERMRGLGVGVLQQLTIQDDAGPITLTRIPNTGTQRAALSGLIRANANSRENCP